MCADRLLLSVVVPCYNEQEVISQTHARLTEVLGKLDVDYEILYVNDGSADGTEEMLRQIQAQDGRVRLLMFSRNFGHQIAVTAGIDNAAGDAVVLIDADLQDPPEVIPQMLQKWREGYQVVYGTRTVRPGETAFKRWTAKAFYRVLGRLSDTAIPLDTGDFRLMDRKVVQALRHMPERDRFVRGMVSWVGFKQIGLPYQRRPRLAGQSKYPLRKMVRFALDGILSFSVVPLRAATFVGLAAAALSLLGIVSALIIRLLRGYWAPPWAFLIIAIFFFGGVQLICTGLIGEYVGRIYMEGKRRPLYVLKDRVGF